MKTKSVEQLKKEPHRKIKSLPVTIYNEKGEKVLETTMEYYNKNKLEIEKKYKLGKFGEKKYKEALSLPYIFIV